MSRPTNGIFAGRVLLRPNTMHLVVPGKCSHHATICSFYEVTSCRSFLHHESADFGRKGTGLSRSLSASLARADPGGNVSLSRFFSPQCLYLRRLRASPDGDADSRHGLCWGLRRWPRKLRRLFYGSLVQIYVKRVFQHELRRQILAVFES